MLWSISFNSIDTDESLRIILYSIFVNEEDLQSASENVIDTQAILPDVSTYGVLKIVGVLQSVIDSYILRHELLNVTAEANQSSISFAFAPLPISSFRKSFQSDSWFVEGISFFVFCVACIHLFFLLGRLQDERQNNLKTYLQCLGLSNKSFYFSGFSFFGLYSLIISLLLSLLLLILFHRDSIGAVWLSNWLLFLHLFPFAILVTAVSSRWNLSKTIGIILFAAIYFVLTRIALSTESIKLKYSLSFFPAISHILSIYHIFVVDVHQLNSVFSEIRHYNLLYGWGISSITLFIYSLIAFFVDSDFFDVLQRKWNCSCKKALYYASNHEMNDLELEEFYLAHKRESLVVLKKSSDNWTCLFDVFSVIVSGEKSATV